jgi:GT2 family glycosyltransferase
MELRPEHITIAVTVYDRPNFVLGAVRSALEQTLPVRVMVVEDCAPDFRIRGAVTGEFGSRVRYIRNPRNRGLFDNWNACLEYCETSWISILHDDDLLHPGFVETMIRLARAAPGKSLYFGQSAVIDERGQREPAQPVPWKNDWREIDLAELADLCFLMFPGQLFRVADAQAVGGVRPHSRFTGDWDLWFRLALLGGGAQTAVEVSTVRTHDGEGRGSCRVERMGWKWALDNMQRKRNLFRLRRDKSLSIPFDRTKLLAQSPIPQRVLLRHARSFPPRLLAYNWWLFVHSKPPSIHYAMFQSLVHALGPKALRGSSTLWNLVSAA